MLQLLLHRFRFTETIRRCFVISMFCLGTANLIAGSDTLRVTQEIRYVTDHAEEVYLVWGINNWNLTDTAASWPASFVKDKLMYTPMVKTHLGFSAKVNVPANTMVDYVFWITKGPFGNGTDIWDKNAAPFVDYHSLALHNNVILVEPAVKIVPKEPLSLLNFAFPACFGFFIALLMTVFISRRFFSAISMTPLRLVLAGGATLLLFLAILRVSVAGFSWDLYFNTSAYLPQVLWAAFYDFVYVICLMTFFIIIILLSRNHRKVQFWSACIFLFSALLSVIFGILNIKVVEMLGKPFNYQWLYYSDFMQSPDSRLALQSNVSYEYIRGIALVCLAAVFCAGVILGLINLVSLRGWTKKVAFGAVLVAGSVYLVYGRSIRKNWDYNKLSNPVTAFLESVNPFQSHPSFFTMEVHDTLRYANTLSKDKPLLALKTASSSAVKNVIFFVMESTPAEYLEVYGSKYKVTPQITKHSKTGIVFKNIYAHAPATNLSMVSLLASVYPGLSYNSITEEHPDLNVPTLSSELHAKGYKNAFFNSADNRFQRAGDFLAHRDFNLITDCQNASCAQSSFTLQSDWQYMNGKDDECTLDEMQRWIKENKSQPFFTTMWTYQTHYPYFFSGKENQYDNDPYFNRYLNALSHSDLVFGKLMTFLKKEKLSSSTLVVVVGDHGEAFGRHDQITHARKIYEENLHVPCIFIHPSLGAVKSDAVGGLVDVAPTVMTMMGLPAPDEWHGSDLFAAGRADRVFFFAPWSDFLFGYREGNYKYIHNASNNISEIYDLAADPLESDNLAPLLPDEVQISHQRMAGWAQFVNKAMLSTLATKSSLQLASKK